MQHHYTTISGGSKRRRHRGMCPAISWPVCKKCGLVLPKNEATERAARKACSGLEDER